MTRPDIDRLVDQLRRGEISRRGFISRAAAIGLSGTAAGVLAGQAAAQDASPEASPVGSPAASPVAGPVTRSITREEYNAALREEYAFEEPAATGGQVITVNSVDLTTLNTTLVVDTFRYHHRISVRQPRQHQRDRRHAGARPRRLLGGRRGWHHAYVLSQSERHVP